MAAIMNAEVTIPLEGEVPEAVMAFVRRCLARDPEMRPADGADAEREIARLEAMLSEPVPMAKGEKHLPAAAPGPVMAVAPAPLGLNRATEPPRVAERWSAVSGVGGCGGYPFGCGCSLSQHVLVHDLSGARRGSGNSHPQQQRGAVTPGSGCWLVWGWPWGAC